MVLHLSTFIVNLGIIIKEMTLETFQFWNQVRGNENEDFSIGINEMSAYFLDTMWKLNPISWFIAAYRDVEDVTDRYSFKEIA